MMCMISLDVIYQDFYSTLFKIEFEYSQTRVTIMAHLNSLVCKKYFDPSYSSLIDGKNELIS
jgi:hypothetical protein